MPLLGGLLVTLFGGLFTQLATVLGTRVAVATAAIASVATLTAALIATMAALSASLMTAFPGASTVALGVYLFVPSNAPVVLAAVFTCDAACALYRWKVQNVRMMAGA